MWEPLTGKQVTRSFEYCWALVFHLQVYNLQFNATNNTSPQLFGFSLSLSIRHGEALCIVLIKAIPFESEHTSTVHIPCKWFMAKVAWYLLSNSTKHKLYKRVGFCLDSLVRIRSDWYPGNGRNISKRDSVHGQCTIGSYVPLPSLLHQMEVLQWR